MMRTREYFLDSHGPSTLLFLYCSTFDVDVEVEISS